MNAPAPHTSLPLAQLLNHTADAVQAVRAGASLNAALAATPGAARPGTQALSFHALRWLGAAQALRAQLAPKTPPPKVDALLLTALALLWPAADAPYAEHTLVDQAVDAARQRAQPSASFVNAVLRRFLRERDALVAAALRDPLARYNHPRWWIDRLKADWPQQWQAILDADNQRPPMTLRVNARHGSVHDYVARLAAQGLDAEMLGGQAVRLARPCAVTLLPGFAQGDVSVQDAAAQRAAPLLIGPGLPAGARVHETLARLNLSAQTVAADAAAPATWWDGRPFDAILLDAPCSAAGIVRRHPDVRWLRRSTDIPALAALQARLLDALWPLLAPGGRLLYCTCSVFKAEGQAQIDAFLQRQPGAALAADPASPGHLLPLPDNRAERPMHDISAAADGFFYALIEKST